MTIGEVMDGTDWLARAATGGLPEPGLRRWQPLRVGIVNLWEYDNAEFWFANGRLVLRGGNGVGKTKVLELTTLMLLRGEVAPPVLDPFGSQHRTMRYNLLPTGEADDPRPPADSSLGYAWAEFGRRDDDGQAHFFTCGVGASARRGTGTSAVTPWQLITQLRPGKDIHLSRAGRPMESKELKKLDGVTVLENATRYRARLAADLFELSPAAYDNLTELLKQLRRPKLGERLNPATLAAILRDALPSLAANEVEQLADGWDRLEKLRQAVEATREAAKQVAGFVRNAWLPWARIVVRRRADTFTAARTKLENTTREKVAADKQLGDARAEVTRLDGALRTARVDRSDEGTALRELLDSQPFQDALAAAHRVDSLTRDLNSLRKRLSDAEGDAESKHAELGRREQAATTAEGKAATARRAVDDRAATVSGIAEAAGLAASVERHLPARDLVGLRADLERRTDRFARLRQLRSAHDAAKQAAEISGQTVSNRQGDYEESRTQEDAAEKGVEAAVEDLRQRIREWASATTAVDCPEEQVEEWCDLVAELTAGDADQYDSSPARAIRAHAEATARRLRARREELLRLRDPLDTELDTVSAKLAEVKALTDLPPPEPSLWRRAARPDIGVGRGAPFWRCVQPRGDVSAERIELLEATLAGSGLLDAWLSPDGNLRTESGTVVADVGLSVSAPASDDTLASVLEPTPAGGVIADTITAALRSIRWHESPPRSDSDDVWLAQDGSWRLGVLAGRAEPSRPASLLGATARDAARDREIETLEGRIATLTTQTGRLSDAIAATDAELSAVDDEIGRIPREKPVAGAVVMWHERRRLRESSDRKLAEATERHQANEVRRDSAWAEFSTFAGEHGFPLHDLDAVATAIERYREALGRLELAVTEAKHLTDAAETASQTHDHQAGLVKEAEATRAKLDGEVRTASVRLTTAKEALSTDHAAQLARRDQLDTKIQHLDDEIEQLNTQLRDAAVEESTAELTLSTHEERRAEAEQERDSALAAWWEAYDSGLAQAVGLVEPDRRVVETGRAAVIEARKDLADIADEHAEGRALRRCIDRLHDLRQQLLPNRDARERDDVDEGGISQFLVLAHSETGWQPPNEAADTLAGEVREREAGYDAEQQQVLATLLGSTFIEHLKDRLDYTERTFAGINDRLVSHPTRQGHAVRLRHEPDPGDPDTSAVVTALNQGYQQLSPARQEMVRSFLARKIDEARAEASADHVADWKEELAAALDYRSWLRIWLEYRPGVGARWRPFDRAQHGAKSGGEKVVLLSQPLFAAAVVAYDAAGEYAPRWVWLDEAMTGVDGPYKASFMGLTVSFDLDVMLTAHDEWCTYSTVPAVAVYDLARQPHLPGVDAQPHLWCGGELTEVVMADASPADRPLAEGGLFAESDIEP